MCEHRGEFGECVRAVEWLAGRAASCTHKLTKETDHPEWKRGSYGYRPSYAVAS